MRRRIVTTPLLLVLLLAWHHAQAAEAAAVYLLCDGKVKTADGEDTINQMRLLVSPAEHTVVGFALNANIDRIDDDSISFSGNSPDTSVVGGLDRVSGTAWEQTTTTVPSRREGEMVVVKWRYDLVCRISGRLF
jgi:hypothetical protein